MSLESRIGRLEEAIGLNDCPCREAAQMQIVYEEGGPEGESTPAPGPCGLCGRPIPVWRIVVVYADSPRARAS